MVGPLHVLAADDDPDVADFYRDALPRLGHRVTLTGTGPTLAELCRDLRPDLIVADLAGLPALEQVWRERAVPVVLASHAFPPDLLDHLPPAQVVSYLVKPVRLSNLQAALALAVGHSLQLQALSREVDSLRQRV